MAEEEEQVSKYMETQKVTVYKGNNMKLQFLLSYYRKCIQRQV